MSKHDDFEAECRARFAYYCRLYASAVFHAEKRKWAEKAYGEIDAYLDWKDVQSL